MAQIFNSTDTLDEQQAVNLPAVNATATVRSKPSNEFRPTRTLKNSVASQSFNGDPNSDFDAVAADIPDNFATNEQPKLKFLFTVQFQPRKGLTTPNENYWGDESMDDNKFALKRAGRPNPQIVYQDMNFYGKRQKVGTRVDYGTVTLTFYDDVVNRAHSIVSQYLNLVSPIANIAKEQADNLQGSAGGAITYGALPHENGPFQWMRVTHHMLDNNSADSGIAKQVYYDYLNPKIVSIALDDLDMTQSDTTNVEIVFAYDSVNITYSDVDTPNPNTTDNSGSPITNNVTGNVVSYNQNQQQNLINQGRQGLVPFDDALAGVSSIQTNINKIQSFF